MKRVWMACAMGLVALGSLRAESARPMSLTGEWRFELDADKVGVAEKWFSKRLGDTIRLPGTTDEAHKGIRNTQRVDDRLSRVWKWIGAAWYQREIEVPEDWKGKRVTLHLERTKDARVWVDGTFCGWNDSLSAPHEFDLSEVMKPGKRVLTILIDNSRVPPVAQSHAIDERTQTNWNGIIGRIELRAEDPVWIKQVQVYPDIANKQARLRVEIGNMTGQPVAGELVLRGRTVNVAKETRYQEQRLELQATQRHVVVEMVWKPEGEVPLWDEFQPALIELDADLVTQVGEVSYRDQHQVRFGMREFRRDRNLLLVNGKRVFLRGRIDCCFYPLTGYPPMDREGWRKVLGQLKDWGLNHVRFHTWTPPRAAFEAADELGFYFQVELPNKSTAFATGEEDDQNAAKHNIDYQVGVDGGTGVSLHEYAIRESEAILREYGNQPSLVMYALGNELGRRPGMYEVVSHLQAFDPRHLYAQGSNNKHWDPSYAEGDDFWVAMGVADERGNRLPLRGAYYGHEAYRGHIDHQAPSTMVDYAASISGIPVPMVVHENAEFEVFPDFHEIPLFTGVTRGWNYEIFRERLEKAGMLDQAGDFMRASGALAAICKREDIESALRTPDLGGYQLLDIQDFAGQGTALVGLLDVFMNPKGIISPEEHRRYCSPTVPLLRMKRYVWTNDESLRGRVQVAHYGAQDIANAVVQWSLVDGAGKELAAGRCEPLTLKQGMLNEVDVLSTPLASVESPQKLTLWLRIEGTPWQNDYPLWVYPKAVDTTVPEGVMVGRSLRGEKIRTHLALGGSVLLLPKPGDRVHGVAGSFQAGFWSPMFLQSARKNGLPDPPVTLGILCDPKHSALARFPTEFHSNWQWWYLTTQARPIILDDAPKDFRPLVQVIDSIGRMHKLGLMFETRVGNGRLFVCAADLMGHQDRPEVRQMLHSLLHYVGSEEFKPSTELDVKLLEKWVP